VNFHYINYGDNEIVYNIILQIWLDSLLFSLLLRSQKKSKFFLSSACSTPNFCYVVKSIFKNVQFWLKSLLLYHHFFIYLNACSFFKLSFSSKVDLPYLCHTSFVALVVPQYNIIVHLKIWNAHCWYTMLIKWHK